MRIDTQKIGGGVRKGTILAEASIHGENQKIMANRLGKLSKRKMSDLN